MKFELGQKVSYQWISKKKDMSGDNYTTLENFKPEDDEAMMTIERRKTTFLKKPRVGYIAGKRRVIFKTVLKEVYESDPEEHDYIEINEQIYRTFYLVASNMRNYDYVLEEDLKEEKKHGDIKRKDWGYQRS